MLGFLKVFARGIICTVLLPLILAAWILYGVYCLITFVFMLIKSVVVFFAGGNAAGEMKEDIEAKRILLEAEQAKVEQAQVMNMMYQNMATQQQMMQQGMAQVPSQPQPAQFNQSNPNSISEQPVASSETEQPINDKEGGNNDGQSY